MFFQSIRWRLQLWQGLLLVFITAALLFGFYRYERTVRLQNLDQELRAQLVTLLPRFSAPPGQPGPPPGQRGPHGDPLLKLESEGFFVGAWAPDERLQYRSPNAPEDLQPPETEPPRAFSQWSGNNYELIQISPRRDVVILGKSADAVDAGLRRFAWTLTLIGIGVSAFGLLGGWWLTTRAIRPISDIAQTAEQIAGGDRARRIHLKNERDELGRLATVLNTTFDRLAQAYDQQVRFTADASHELRTPVSVILAKAQVTLARERSAEEYRDALQVCQRAGERMKELLGDLLELARFDAGTTGLRVRECDLREVAREALEFVTPLAEERQVKITESLTSIRGRFDPVGLSQVLINLLSNAIKHNPEGCAVHVSLEQTGNFVRLAIADSGRGISSEALPHLFERFYREDKARARSTGGSGLGLAIAQAIVEAHGGSLSATSGEGRGSTFTISLPV